MNNIKLLFEDIEIDENIIYFFSKNFNGLLSFNMTNGKVLFLAQMPEEDSEKERLACKIVKHKNKLFLLPMNSDKIWIYFLDQDKWQYIKFAINQKYLPGKFFQGIIYQNQLYMIGANYPGIIAINMDDYSLEYYTNLYDSFIGLKEELKDCYVRTDYVLKDNTLYLATCLSNKILIFNLDSHKGTFFQIGDTEDRFSGITYDGEFFWIAPRKKGSLIKWNGDETTEPVKVKLYNNSMNNYFLGIVNEHESIFLPGQIDSKSVRIYKNNSLQQDFLDESYLFYKKYRRYTIAMNTSGKLTIRKGHENIFDDFCYVDKEDIRKHYKLSLFTQENVNDVVGLDFFLQKIIER